GFAFGDLVAGKLAGHHRVEALDALRRLTVGDRLHLERVKLAELGDLVERQCRVVDQPDSSRLGHQECAGHEEKSFSFARVPVAGGGQATNMGKSASDITAFSCLRNEKPWVTFRNGTTNRAGGSSRS